MDEYEKYRWVQIISMWRDAYQDNAQLYCTKRFEWIDNGFHSDFCRECWRIYMFEYYWTRGLGKYRFWCIADNCAKKEIVDSVLQNRPDLDQSLVYPERAL